MEKTVNRPQRLALSELDSALQLALTRVAQANELSQEECQGIAGGIATTSGRFPPPAEF